MNKPEDGTTVISAADLADAPYSSQVTLKILMERGAPIIGCCVLCLDARYRWFTYVDHKTKAVTFEWKVKD